MCPYLPETNISKIGRYLPQGIQERKKEIRSFMPRYGCINERKNQLHEVIRLSGMNIIINEVDRPLVIKVASISAARMQVYFIDNEDYFHRKQVYFDESGEFFKDNAERAAFFARGVLETVKKLRWAPDVIHCHGWISALVPLYIKSAYCEEPSFRESKVVFSLYDTNFNNPLDENFTKKLLCKDMVESLVEGVSTPITYEELAKLAIRYSDGVILNSPNIPESLIAYANELGKPVLPYQEAENYADACNEFYDKF
jgi:starch synthase